MNQVIHVEFPDNTKMSIEIPEGSDFLDRVAKYVNKAKEQVSPLDIGFFISRATIQAMDKHLDEHSD